MIMNDEELQQKFRALDRFRRLIIGAETEKEKVKLQEHRRRVESEIREYRERKQGELGY